jgi:Rod binding domain-containing protein
MTAAAPVAGLVTFANRQGVTPAGAGQATETAAHRKLRKAAQDFEAILISELWEHFQSSFSSLSGDAPPAGSDTLSSLALQAMSAGLAQRGGFGIARMLVRQLEPGLDRGPTGQTGSKIKTASSG